MNIDHSYCFFFFLNWRKERVGWIEKLASTYICYWFLSVCNIPGSVLRIYLKLKKIIFNLSPYPFFKCIFQGALSTFTGLPWWLRWWGIFLQYRRPRFNPWVGKVLWRSEGQPTPVFLPGESHGQREPGGLQSMGSQRVVYDWVTNTHTHTNTHTNKHSHRMSNSNHHPLLELYSANQAESL